MINFLRIRTNPAKKKKTYKYYFPKKYEKNNTCKYVLFSGFTFHYSFEPYFKGFLLTSYTSYVDNTNRTNFPEKKDETTYKYYFYY